MTTPKWEAPSARTRCTERELVALEPVAQAAVRKLAFAHARKLGEEHAALERLAFDGHRADPAAGFVTRLGEAGVQMQQSIAVPQAQAVGQLERDTALRTFTRQRCHHAPAPAVAGDVVEEVLELELDLVAVLLLFAVARARQLQLHAGRRIEGVLRCDAERNDGPHALIVFLRGGGVGREVRAIVGHAGQGRGGACHRGQATPQLEGAGDRQRVSLKTHTDPPCSR